MKQILSFLLFIFFACGFSQQTTLNGRVVKGKLPVAQIDVINMNTKKTAQTNKEGKFSIAARPGEELFFISKDLQDRRIVLKHADFKAAYTVQLEEKPIELDEVKVSQSPIAGYKVSQAELDNVKLEKQLSRPTNSAVYTGETVNGVDFARIGRDIIKFFKKRNADKTPATKIVFKEYVADNFQDSFFTEKLGLQPEQVAPFMEYCQADPKAETVAQNNNILVMMDFLITKSEAYKKL